MNTALALFHGGRSRLRFALKLATQDRHPLCDILVDDILHLRDLLERAYATPDGARWVRETLQDAAAPHRPDRTESSASDSSTTTGQRRREEPSTNGIGTRKVKLCHTDNGRCFFCFCSWSPLKAREFYLVVTYKNVRQLQPQHYGEAPISRRKPPSGKSRAGLKQLERRLQTETK